MSRSMLKVERLAKTFTLHLQDGLRLPVLEGADLSVAAGECVGLTGASGSGKSTLLRCLYGNYLPEAGSIRLRHRGQWVELSGAAPRTVLAVRRETLGYVSQFLHVIPRVPALELVAEPLVAQGESAETAREQAGALLARLHIPERLWSLPPATFSGGEQQRVNIARGLIARRPVLLLDEPTASLDADNGTEVLTLIREARDRGAAIVGIFHDAAVRERVCDRCYDVTAARKAA